MSTQSEEFARRRLHEALTNDEDDRRDDRHFEAVFEHSFQSIWVLAPDGTILDVNPTALALMRASRPDVLGTRLWEASCWGGDSRLRTDLRSAVSSVGSGAFVRFEAEIPASGDVATLDLSFTSLPGPARRPALVVVEGRDVGARARADRALRESEERFNRIVSIAADAIISMDETHRITLFNHGAEQIFGYAASEVVGQPLDILLPGGVGPSHAQSVRQFAAGPVSARRMGERREIFGRRKTGEVFRADASISKVSVGGRLVFTAVVRDVSERWMREQERAKLLEIATSAREDAERERAQVAFLAELSDALSASLEYEELARTVAGLAVPQLAAFCMVDVVMDTGGLKRVGVQHADPDAHAATDVLRTVELRDDLPYLTKRALITGEPELLAPLQDQRLVESAADKRHLEALRALGLASLFCVPVIARGHTLGVIAFGRTAAEPPFSTGDRDLCLETTRRVALAMDNARLYRRAQDASRQRDLVLGVVSHDLRNPLSAIGMCVTGLEHATGENPEERVEMLATIRASADWAQRLIGDLLDVSSIEAGRLSFEPQAIDPMRLVGRAIDLFEAESYMRSIRLTLGASDTVPPIVADESRILQVLSNLLSNAMKFTAPGGTVVLSVKAGADAVVFAVRDDGPGIPPEDVPLLFDRFWRARRGDEGRGTGLGLAIAKGIVEAHGGRIWVDTAPGVGTTFKFSLPRVPRSEAMANVTVPTEPTTDAMGALPGERFGTSGDDRPAP